MLNFNTIKEQIVAAEAATEAAAKAAAKAADERKEAFMKYTCELIEAHMNLDTENRTIFASIAREEMTPEFWELFESNGVAFKTRLPEALNKRLGGVKVAFNSLRYGKEEEDGYVFFFFAVELI